MNQGDESPLFCRDDTPPRSGVPPGYVSIRLLLLQRQQSSSNHQIQRTIESEVETPQSFSDADASTEEDDGASSTLINLDYEPENDASNVATVATDSRSAPNTSLVSELSAFKGYDEREDATRDENQASHDDGLFESLEAPAVDGVPPGYQSLRAVMGRRAGEGRSPVAQSLLAIAEEPRGHDMKQQRSIQMHPTSQHSFTNRVASSGRALSQTAPLRPQPPSRPIPNSQPTSTQSVCQQQRPILPYVFQPSGVPQTPMESILAAPLITKGEARSGTAVYPSYSPVTTTTAEGLYTLTDAQVYWNSRGRPQCFKIGCDNNQGIGYGSEASRDEHISNSRFHKEVSHLGYEQTKRGYQNGRDYPLL
ncbi:hypothetical protein KCU77_g186, partial [Aureobasidium melanogenum]